MYFLNIHIHHIFYPGSFRVFSFYIPHLLGESCQICLLITIHFLLLPLPGPSHHQPLPAILYCSISHLAQCFHLASFLPTTLCPTEKSPCLKTSQGLNQPTCSEIQTPYWDWKGYVRLLGSLPSSPPPLPATAHSAPIVLTWLFTDYATLVTTSGLCRCFLLPGMLFSQIFAWLLALFHSGLLSHATLSKRTS